MLISAGELIKKSFTLYKQNGGLFLKYVILSYIPALIIGIAMIFLGGAAGFLYFGNNKGGAGVAIVILALLFFAAILASLWIFIAFIRVIASRYLNKAVEPVGAELKKAKAFILSCVGASIVYGAAILGGTLLFFIPGFIFSIWFVFYFYEIALDNKRAMESLSTSKRLVSGRWLAIFWRMAAPAFVFGIITFIVTTLIELPIETVSEGGGSATLIGIMNIVASFLIIAVNTIMAPLTVGAQVILYIEAKNNPVADRSNTEAPSQQT